MFDSEGNISLVPEYRLSWTWLFAVCLGPFTLIPECTPHQASSASFQTSFLCDFSDFRCGVFESFGLLRRYAGLCWQFVRVCFKPDGTRWRTGYEVKGKLANGLGSQYFHTASECGVSSITNADAHTSAASSRLNYSPANLNGLVRLCERRNVVSARVPSGSARALLSWFEFKFFFLKMGFIFQNNDLSRKWVDLWVIFWTVVAQLKTGRVNLAKILAECS